MSTQPITAQTVQAQTEATPVNAVTRKSYFGDKAKRLLAEATYRGYPSHEWATLKQWNSVKETIAKGEKGTLMIHIDTLTDGTEQQNRSFLYNRCQLVQHGK